MAHSACLKGQAVLCSYAQPNMNKMRPLFGLKWVRLGEWARDVWSEKPGLNEFYHMGLLAVKSVLKPISRKAYIHRLWTCYHCPVFNRKLKNCRHGRFGCGCYMPYKALGPVDCWAREQMQPVKVKGRWIGALDGWGKTDQRRNDAPILS